MAKGNGLLYLGLGAALMYLCDPQSGRKRRADLQNQAESALRDLQRARDVLVRDAGNRAHGAIAQTRRWVDKRKAVREGTWPGGEEAAGAARGVLAAMDGPWSPTSRAAAGALGAGMVTYGYFCGGLRGFLYGLIGGGLVARATTNREIASLVKGAAPPIEKTIRISAPVEEVFAYWRNLENFPQWMSHVREVRYGGGDRYHWIVDGPAGVPIEWDSELLNVVENREMTWRSVEGSAVSHTGRVRFEPDADGTRVHVQLRYAPMGGLIGHAVAKAFGVDPRSEMDDDLVRLKSLVETGRPARDSAVMRGGDGATPAM
jgi:uncharacterized membrane protein